MRGLGVVWAWPIVGWWDELGSGGKEMGVERGGWVLWRVCEGSEMSRTLGVDIHINILPISIKHNHNTHTHSTHCHSSACRIVDYCGLESKQNHRSF